MQQDGVLWSDVFGLPTTSRGETHYFFFAFFATQIPTKFRRLFSGQTTGLMFTKLSTTLVFHTSPDMMSCLSEILTPVFNLVYFTRRFKRFFTFWYFCFKTESRSTTVLLHSKRPLFFIFKVFCAPVCFLTDFCQSFKICPNKQILHGYNFPFGDVFVRFFPLIMPEI